MSANSSDLPPAIFLMGPTATGKTDLAIALRAHLPVEIISVDSALIYRGMDIGTAKPEQAVLREHPHRMVDICDPADPFSVAGFLQQTRKHMAEITHAGKIPLLVGGTMLYFRALLDGLADIPEVPAEVREQIERESEQYGWPHLHKELQTVDPETARDIHPNHSRRIQRALEVYRGTGQPMSFYRNQQQQAESDHYSPVGSAYRVIQLALLPQDRAALHHRIEARFLGMLEAGFEEEVRGFLERGDLDISMPSMRAVGYRQMWNYLEGKTTQQEMIDQGVAATRQLAKRQLTWLRKWNELYPLYIDKACGDTKKNQNLLAETLKILSEKSV